MKMSVEQWREGNYSGELKHFDLAALWFKSKLEVYLNSISQGSQAQIVRVSKG
jgi:hypothetical protein